MVAALSENFLDPIFLAKVAFAHKLDVAAVFRRQPLGILPQPVAERLGEPRVVENADVALVQVRGHALGKADPRQRAEQQDPIPAGKRPRDLGCVAFRQQRQAHSGIIPWSNNLFGSGYAGLGESRWMSVSRALFSFGFLQAVLALVGIAILVGIVIWLLERGKTEHFRGGTRGLGIGLWWSAIAMTQAGAAQNAPATLLGRIVAIGWMIASIIVIAVFTAGITSTLTQRELQGAVNSVNDLRSVRVGAPVGSTSTDYLDHQR